MRRLTFPPIHDFGDTEPMRYEEVRQTPIDVLQDLEPALATEIIRGWGMQKIHDEMSQLLMGNGRRLSFPVVTALLDVFTVHAERFKLEAVVNDKQWWHVRK